jgi:hypothetical protein
MRKFVVSAAVLLLVTGLFAAWGVSAQDKDSRWAYVENQTGDGITLSYAEKVDGDAAKSQLPVLSGATVKLDTTVVKGEVCAWRMPPLKPAEKIGCRALSAGDHWVIR